MARARTRHRCEACGVPAPKWSGRCTGCGEWNTMIEEEVASSPGLRLARDVPAVGAVPLSAVDAVASVPRPTGVTELDRVLGGGLVRGSITLLGGEPGVGKSTLLLQVCTAVSLSGRSALVVSAEESAQQVRRRAERLEALPDDLLVLASGDLRAVHAALDQHELDLVVVDSIQTVTDPDVVGSPGSVAQVRACAEALAEAARARGVAVVLVGHVTKDGALAGPRTLEHLVDTVLSMEGDRHYALRLVRAVKHRFAGTGEVGLFEMVEGGLAPVTDPYRLLLGDRRPGAPGAAVLPMVEGARALLVEIQALVAPPVAGGPRRSARGVDAQRLPVLLAVLDRACGAHFGRSDVFASVVGGLRVAEPAGDLALALALTSAAWARPVPADLVAFGEVGLAGEVRQSPHAPRRLAEAARLGFRHAMVPESTPDGPPGMELIRVRSLLQAVTLACGPPPGAAAGSDR